VSVGEVVPRADGLAKATGAAVYPGDLAPPGALWAKVVFSGVPHARMVAMDVGPTLGTDGVVDVLTAADVPVNEYGLTVFDQPVLVGLDGGGRSRVPCDVSRWEGDQIAVVVAETPEIAEEAAGRIEVAWEPLPLVPDVASALADEVLVHPERGSNAYAHLRIRKGDMAAGWATADVVVEATYRLPHQEHAYLQPEAAVSYLDGEDRITVVVAGQWAHEDREQIAHALDLPPERIRVVYPSIGGAFGGREDMSLQIVMALAAWKLDRAGIRRPVRTVWSREESIVGHHKRHRAVVRARWGATRDGKLVAIEADATLDAGAYNYTSNKVLGNLHLTLAGPYEVPHVHIDSRAVYTTSVPGGAFRGFGAPQGAFVAENQMNRLAAALGMDPVELRLANGFREGSIGVTQTPLPPGVSLPEVIEACAEAARWSEGTPAAAPFTVFASLPPARDRVRTGRGFACAFKNVGFSFGFPERCEATIELHGDERVDRVVLRQAGADVGQGSHTAFLQMAAEATGVPLDRVDGVFSDTAETEDSGSASASRLTWMAGNAILGAADEAEKRWREGDRPAIGRFRFVPPPTEALDPATGRGDPNFAYGYVAEAATVSVDLDTGHLRVTSVVCATDVGRAINPRLVAGQVHGAIAQAHGYAVTERLVLEEGRILNPRLSAYLIPGVGDVPDRVEVVVLEIPDPRGPWGARGMAEMPFIPFAPAVVAALHDATGIWFDEIPLTPDRVLAALRSAGV